MKLAVCVLCGEGAWETPAPNSGDWVRFSEYVQIDHPPLGHPDGLEYYCNEHVGAARELSSKTSAEALAELRQRFGIAEPRTPRKPEHKLPPSRWKHLHAFLKQTIGMK